jgi:imidazolonepropionase
MSSMPGFVDPHTHAIWAGDRSAEFEMRLQGKTYLEIQAAGGGIISTVQATRTASLDKLLAETRPRLWNMFLYGTTTAEVKTGYGLRTSVELRMLQALLALEAEGPLELAITFLGAHAIAPEFQDDPDGYTEVVCVTMLPLLQEWWPHHAPYLSMPFVDVFCETGAFNLEQSREILDTARCLGFPLKIHADEFDNLGGTRLAVELERLGDHLVATSPEDIQALAASDTVAIACPAPLRPGRGRHTPARHPGGRWPAGNRNRPEPRYSLVREYAVRHCPGLPLPAPDTSRGDRCSDHQRSSRHRARRSHRLPGAG